MNVKETRLHFAVKPIPAAVATRVRHALKDDFGNELVVRKSDSPAPCRQCLRVVPAGTELIVFAYRPFDRNGPYAEVGPIFIHADECTPYAERHRFPPDFVERTLTMRGYNEQGTIEAAELSEPGNPEASLARLFSNDRVRFVHVRNPAWGCFDFVVERATR